MITLIVLDYKTMPQTISYIRQFQEKARPEVHTVIVDNAGDTGLLKKAFSEAGGSLEPGPETEAISQPLFRAKLDNREWIVVCSGKNGGYAAGNNLGARTAEALYHSPYLIFSNNDIVVPAPIDLTLLTVPLKEYFGAAVTGPEIIGPGGESQSPRKRESLFRLLFLPYLDMLLPPGLKFVKNESGMEESGRGGFCDWLSGSFLCVDSRKFKKAGGFDENTFLYCEEMILMERLKAWDQSMYFVPSVRLLHMHGSTVNSTFRVLQGIKISFTSALYYAENYRNAGKPLLAAARVWFGIFSFLFTIKKKLVRLFKRP